MSLPDDMEFHLLDSFEEAEAFMRWLGERRPVLAVDTETSGLRWWDGQLRLVQFGDLRTGWAIPFEKWAGLCQIAFDRYTGPLAFHNAKFDLHWLEQFGCKPKRHLVDDTQLMVHILEPRLPMGLKSAGQRHVDPLAGAGQQELKTAMSKARWDWGNVPVELESYWVYAAMDAVLTAHLHQKLKPRVDATQRRVYDLELAVMQILLSMEKRGVRVDLDYCAKKREELEAHAQAVREWSKAAYGFLPTSNKQVAARLMQDGVVLTKKTQSGAWCLDEEVLSTIDHELAQAALIVRKSEKLARSYFAAFEELAVNGFVHPNVRQVGARTGRMSVTDPGLQTLPRGREVRDAFIAREGHTMIGIDYEQIEARLFAHFSNDTDMAQLFREGDFFSGMAERIFGEPIDKSDPRRQITKSSMYAKIYGAGTAKFALTAGISEAEAATFLKALDSSFPSIRELQHKTMSVAKQRLATEGEAYLVTPHGRREPADSGEEYKLVNALIQGTAADILKQVMVELDAMGLAEHLVMPVHDELIFDAPSESVDELTAEICSVMERKDEWLVPLEVDAHTGPSWGSLK
jgi:DNA polymerase-1